MASPAESKQSPLHMPPPVLEGADPGYRVTDLLSCGESGHMTRQCPNESVTLRSKASNVSYGASYGDDAGESGDRACFNCGQAGHSKADCPEPRKMGACYNCGEEGHSKADCPQPRKMGACFNCGEEGHSKADCPQPRVFKGACRVCEKEGHPAAECPERPPDVCKNCLSEGHRTIECTEKRKFDLNHVADMLPVEAWAAMKKASDEKDLDDFREALKIYSKSSPEETFADVEKKMREEDFKIFIIGLVSTGLVLHIQGSIAYECQQEKEVDDVISLIDLQGTLDREYVVGFYFRAKASRGKLRERWPADPEENLERLANAGLPFERMIPKCLNCGELGHIKKSCKEERVENDDRVEIKCSNCDEVGHRVRDCMVKRKYRHGCRNCGSGDHIAAECTEERSAEGVECRRCNQSMSMHESTLSKEPRCTNIFFFSFQAGHFAKDCPTAGDRGPRQCRNCGSEDHLARECDQPRNPATMTCRNCEQVGHLSKDCPQPRDYSKVQCNNCGEFGHTFRRCKQPPKEEAEDVPSFSPPGSPPHGSFHDRGAPAAAGGDDEGGFRRRDQDDRW
ncbi:unnamed protein product [Penicillium salamii]|nr:unnamed protein product [Penicillium salamii]